MEWFFLCVTGIVKNNKKNFHLPTHVCIILAPGKLLPTRYTCLFGKVLLRILLPHAWVQWKCISCTVLNWSIKKKIIVENQAAPPWYWTWNEYFKHISYITLWWWKVFLSLYDVGGSDREMANREVCDRHFETLEHRPLLFAKTCLYKCIDMSNYHCWIKKIYLFNPWHLILSLVVISFWEPDLDRYESTLWTGMI